MLCVVAICYMLLCGGQHPLLNIHPNNDPYCCTYHQSFFIPVQSSTVASTTSCVPIPLLIDIWIISRFQLLQFD